MKAEVYIFGNFASGYSQYPDDYTRDLFESISKSRKGATELAYHRDGTLTYYIYTREVSRAANTFIGLCCVFNGILISDIAYLFETFEDTFTNIVFKGELLELSNDGGLSTKIRQLYTNAEELQRVSEYINNKLFSQSSFEENLPPVNYSISQTEWQVFSFEQVDKVRNAIKRCPNLRVMKGENYDTDSLREVVHIVKSQNDEIKTLKEDISQKDNKISELERQLNTGTRDKTPPSSPADIPSEKKPTPPTPPMPPGTVAIIIIIAIIIIGGVFFILHQNNVKHRCQVEADYKALKDSCDVHFEQGSCDECREDIENMKKMEKENTWLKAFSNYYSSIVEANCN